MAKQITHKRPAPPRAGRAAGKTTNTPNWVTAILGAFGCGTGAAILLLAVFAFLSERMSLPVTAVRPLALAAAWCGSAVSGYVLAKGLGKQRLLCGLCSGLFYCLCLLAASFMAAGEVFLEGSNMALPIALLLGGLIGGVVSALRAVSGTPMR